MGWVVNATPRPLYPQTRYPFYRRVGGPQGRSGRLRETSPPTNGIRSLDRPACSESQYRPRYAGPHGCSVGICNPAQRLTLGRWDDAVGIVTMLRAVRPKNRGSIPGRLKDFFSKASVSALSLTSLLYNGHRGTFRSGVKRSGREADHSSPDTDVKNGWSCTSILLYVLVARTETNVTFTACNGTTLRFFFEKL